MSEILYPKESEPDSQDSTVQPWAQSCGRYKSILVDPLQLSFH